jgi:ketopantoate reductase
MELEALVGAVVELGERVGLPMTITRTVYKCVKLLAQSAAQQSKG